jgi:hypothetical protein
VHAPDVQGCPPVGALPVHAPDVQGCPPVGALPVHPPDVQGCPTTVAAVGLTLPPTPACAAIGGAKAAAIISTNNKRMDVLPPLAVIIGLTEHTSKYRRFTISGLSTSTHVAMHESGGCGEAGLRTVRFHNRAAPHAIRAF